MGERRGAYKSFVGQPEGETTGRRGHRWKEHKQRIYKAWDGGIDWIGLAENMDRWYALVNAIINLCVSKNTGIY
jgi:hypothetical protein